MEALSMAEKLDHETLVRRHHVGVWRYLRFLGCGRDQADDLTQETFLVFLRKPFDFHGHASTSAYLRKIARFIYLEARRQQAGNVDNIEEAEQVFSDNAGDSDGDQYLEALGECVKTLAGKAGEAVKLQYAEQRTQQQIAELLGMKPNGVKTLLQRARAHLRECIERRLR
jgi:RNA polymerase sigma-70 factor (ECF subfamily)